MPLSPSTEDERKLSLFICKVWDSGLLHTPYFSFRPSYICSLLCFGLKGSILFCIGDSLIVLQLEENFDNLQNRFYSILHDGFGFGRGVFHPDAFVCVCVCHDVRPDDLTMKD